MNSQTFVIAVSGGVDSVVLLHRLLTNKPPKIRYVVAHYDHGIRADSQQDAKFVEDLAKQYNMQFELGQGELGPAASEAQARSARYAFLRMVAKQHKADKVITAHHQDDLLESIVLGMLRSNGYRALLPMTATDILRPLIHKRKSELRSYATEHKLVWREDPTNRDEKYLRNYVRTHVMPSLEPARAQLLALHNAMQDTVHDIDMRTTSLVPTNNAMNRARYCVMPYSVLCEIVRGWLRRSGVAELDSTTIERVATAIKTLPIGKKIDVTSGLWLKSYPTVLLLTKEK